MEKKKVPEIRLEGFEGEWEKKKLGELYECNNERNVNKNIGFDKTISVATMNYKEDGNGAALDSLATYKILRLGDIAFEGHTNKEFLYGRFVLNDIGDGIMSPRFSALHPKKIFPISFWKYYIHHEPVMRKILVNSTKAGTMMNELDIDDFLEQVIYVPGDDEQKTIGEYFTNLDNLITNAEDRHTKLLALKRSLLQKMFPQEGESVPKIRFEGFEGDWEKKKIGELYTLRNQKNDMIYDTDKIISVASMKFNPEIRISDKEYLQTYNVFKLGDIAFEGHSNKEFLHGRFVENVIGDGIVSHIFSVFQPIEKYDLLYWKYAINNENIMQRVLIKTTKASRMMNDLVIDDLLNEYIYIPNIDEQKAIGTYFDNLDTLIEAQEQKITKLRQMKSALLQKMFV